MENSDIVTLLLRVEAELKRMDEWLTVKQAAEYLKLSVSTVYSLIYKGIIPYSELPGSNHKFIKRKWLDQILEENRRYPEGNAERMAREILAKVNDNRSKKGIQLNSV